MPGLCLAARREANGKRERSIKFQASSVKKAPNSKHQIPNTKHQTSGSKPLGLTVALDAHLTGAVLVPQIDGRYRLLWHCSRELKKNNASTCCPAWAAAICGGSGS